jgi:hypothetical protein
MRVPRNFQTYLGESVDIENSTTIDFCTYFQSAYGDHKEVLKNKFKKIESDLMLLTGWNPDQPQASVVEANPDDIPDFTLAPWQLGFTAKHSIKGKSKLCNTLDTVKEFLKRPYASKTEPLQVVFGLGSQVGGQIEDWSVRLSIGMSKASACRMILEAVSALNLQGQDLVAVAGQIKALLRMRCTYDPAPTEEEQFQRAMGGKNMVTERPRPDPLQWGSRWAEIFRSNSVDFAAAIDLKIKQFNSNRTEGFGILEHEAAFIKA